MEGKLSRKLDDRVWIILHPALAKERVLLGRRRLGSKNAGEYGFFGGHVDMGETPRQAARRELLEETTLECLEDQDLKFVCVVARKDVFIYYFTLSKDELIENELIRTEEIDDYKVLDIEDLCLDCEGTDPDFLDYSNTDQNIQATIMECSEYPLHYSVTLFLLWWIENGQTFPD